MSMSELTKKVQEAAENRTHVQRVELLRQAKIIDSDGYYLEDFFSSKTVAKDKESGAAVRV